MLSPWAFLIIIAGVAGSYFARKLTLTAALAGGVVAGFCYLGAGFTGLAMLGVFFVLASIATSVRFEKKVSLGLAEGIRGRRTFSQVLANGGVPAICCAMGFLIPGYQPVFQLMAAAALSAAAADSVSSEIGNAFGSGFYNITSFKKDKQGLDGVISPEGTFAGLTASAVISIINAFDVGWDQQIFYIIIGGTAGNMFDSFLGAGFERRGLLGNDEVNFLNTAFGAFTALLLMLLFG